MKQKSRFNRTDLLIFSSVFFISLITYIRTLCPTVYVGDSGELIAACATLGIPHPPGFPLYVILGKMFISILRFSNIAYRMNLFSALCAAIASGILGVLLRRIFSVGAVISILFGLSFAFSSTHWSVATVAVTYPLSSLLCAAGIFALLLWSENREEKYLCAFFLIVGLDAAVHTLSTVLFLAGLIFISLNLKWDAQELKKIFKPALFMLPGLCLYLLIPLRAAMKPALNWSDPSTLPRLVRFLTRGEYWEHAYVRDSTDFFEVIAHYLKIIPSEFSFIGLILLLFGAFYLAKKNWKQLCLFLSLFVINIFAMVLHGSRSDIFYWPRYMLTGFIGLSLIIGAGFVYLKDILKHKVVYFAIAAILPLFLFLSNFYMCDKSRNFVAHDYNMAILDYLPDKTVLMAESDNVLFPLVYFHIAEKKRPDINLVQQGIEVLTQMRINPKTEPIYFTHYHDFKNPLLKLVPDGLSYRLLLKESDYKSGFDWNKFTLRNLRLKGVYLDYLSRNLVGDYLFSRGITLEFEDFNKALVYFRDAAKVDYNNSNMFVNLGLVYERHGMYKEAVASFTRALKIDKKEEVAQRHLLLLEYRGDF